MTGALAALLLAAVAPEMAASACDEAAEQLKTSASQPDFEERKSEAVLAVQSLRAALADRELEGVALRLPWIQRMASSIADAGDDEVGERIQFAQRRMQRLCAALRAPAGAASQFDRAKLVSILGKPEYQLRSRDETFLFRLFEQLRTWLRDVFATARGVREASNLVRAVFLSSVCAAVMYLAWRLARVRLRKAAASATSPVANAFLDDPEHYQRSSAAAIDRGDAREAIRLGLLRLLATLERARLTSSGRAATNREVAEQVARRGGGAELAGRARKLLTWYDETWYGLATITLPEARRFLEGIGQCCQGALAARIQR